MHTYLLGIDIGTGSCKGTLLGMDGAPTGKAEREHTPLFLSEERVEQDPHTWWQSASEVSRRLLHAASITPGQIAGVGVTGQMRGITLIGKPEAPNSSSDQRFSARSYSDEPEASLTSVESSPVSWRTM